MANFSDLHMRRYEPTPLEWKGRYVRNWFSNFEQDGMPISYLGRETRCLEVAFVAAKNPGDTAFVDAVFRAGAGKAKRLGRSTVMRADWDSVNLGAMDFFLRQKWRPGTPLSDRLTATDGPLPECNNWGDARWGCVLPDWTGRNALGLLLERVRSELRDGFLDPGAPEEDWAAHGDYLAAAMNAMESGALTSRAPLPDSPLPAQSDMFEARSIGKRRTDPPGVSAASRA